MSHLYPNGTEMNGTLTYQLHDPRTAAEFAPTWNSVCYRNKTETDPPSLPGFHPPLSAPSSSTPELNQESVDIALLLLLPSLQCGYFFFPLPGAQATKNWTVRSDVWVWFNEKGKTDNGTWGDLSVGYGCLGSRSVPIVSSQSERWI